MSKKTLFKGVRIITGKGDMPLENSAMLVEGKTIRKIGKAQEMEAEKDAEVIDLTGKTIMPGLIDCHIHIMFEPVGSVFENLKRDSVVKTISMVWKRLDTLLKSGVTFFRDMGGYNYLDIEIKRVLASQEITGPDFLACGKVLTITGGHCWQVGRECDGENECRKAAREQIKAGADFIKVAATGGVMTAGTEPGAAQMNLNELQAIVEEAHKFNRRTAAHAQGMEGIKNALKAGIDCIEHGTNLDDEAIEMMLAQNAYLVPTLSAPHFIIKEGIAAGIPASMVDKTKAVSEKHKESVRKARKAGIKIAVGTDAGTPFNYHGNTAFEMLLLIEQGFSPLEAITAATKTAAEVLEIGKSHGSLEEGKNADFLVLKENPLENIRTIFDIAQVYKNGRPVK